MNKWKKSFKGEGCHNPLMTQNPTDSASNRIGGVQFVFTQICVQSRFSFRRDRSYISKNLMANSLFAKVSADRRTSSLSGVTF